MSTQSGAAITHFSCQFEYTEPIYRGVSQPVDRSPFVEKASPSKQFTKFSKPCFCKNV